MSLKVSDLRILSSDDCREVFKLLHLLQVGITFLVDGLEVLIVDQLHVAQRFFEVGDISMARCQRVS